MSDEHHRALVLARQLLESGEPANHEALLHAWDVELAPHFEVEERYLLPALAAAGEQALVERTLREHGELHRLVSDPAEQRRFAALLKAHVRFEERELFAIAERRLTPEILNRVSTALGSAPLDVAREKRTTRRVVRQRLQATTATERAGWSERIAQEVMRTVEWQTSPTVALFHGSEHEVDTRPLLEAAWTEGKRVLLPRTPALGLALDFRLVGPDTALERNRHEVWQPGEDATQEWLTPATLVLAPCLAFDHRGARLGHGGGYYDRTLVSAPVLLAFACQERPWLPAARHDRRAAAVVTEHGHFTLPRWRPCTP